MEWVCACFLWSWSGVHWQEAALLHAVHTLPQNHQEKQSPTKSQLFHYNHSPFCFQFYKIPGIQLSDSPEASAAEHSTPGWLRHFLRGSCGLSGYLLDALFIPYKIWDCKLKDWHLPQNTGETRQGKKLLNPAMLCIYLMAAWSERQIKSVWIRHKKYITRADREPSSAWTGAFISLRNCAHSSPPSINIGTQKPQHCR